MSETPFPDLLARVRAGDQQAADELVRVYEPSIRRVLRIRFTDPALRRQFDSEDLCQSVFGDFFVRAALGQFDLSSPEQLVKLLAAMTRNKVLRKVEHQHAQRRDVRRQVELNSSDSLLAGQQSTASQIVMRQELVSEFRRRLSADELYLCEQRAAGRNWQDLAAELQVPADTLRMRHRRTLDRLYEELGLETSCDPSIDS